MEGVEAGRVRRGGRQKGEERVMKGDEEPKPEAEKEDREPERVGKGEEIE